MKNLASPVKLTTVSFDGVSFLAPSWEQMGRLVFELSRQILARDHSYEIVVALAKGGWTWARTLVDYLENDNLVSMRLKLYRGVSEKEKEPEIILPVPVDVKNKKLLIFDDVSDSGQTLKKALDHVWEKGAREVSTATLFYKPQSIIKPDFFVYQTSAWIVFPHEIWEFIREVGLKWLKNGLSKDQLVKRFKALSLPEEQVEYLVERLVKNP